MPREQILMQGAANDRSEPILPDATRTHFDTKGGMETFAALAEHSALWADCCRLPRWQTVRFFSAKRPFEPRRLKVYGFWPSAPMGHCLINSTIRPPTGNCL